MITPTIYDWPASVFPINQLFYAGGEASESVFTIGEVLAKMPEPGGRAYMDMAFNYMGNDSSSRIAAWLMSKISNGNIFRVPIRRSVQLAMPFSAPGNRELTGVPWDNGQPWDNGMGWAYEPVVYLASDALEGSITVVVNTSTLGQIFQVGHVIGPNFGGAHIIDDIDYDGAIATMKINPPLRRDLTVVENMITARPRMFGYVDSPDNFRSMLEYGRWVRPGNLTLSESIVLP